MKLASTVILTETVKTYFNDQLQGHNHGFVVKVWRLLRRRL